MLPHEQIPISHKIRGLGRWDVVAELGREAWGRSPLAQRPLIRQDDAATGSAVYACGAAWRAAHDARPGREFRGRKKVDGMQVT